MKDELYNVSMNPSAWDGITPTDVVKTYKALQCVSQINLTENWNIPPQCIAVNNITVAMVDEYAPWDSFSPELTGDYYNWVQKNNPGLILKYQFRNGVKYPERTISAGFYCSIPDYLTESFLLKKDRPIDITARMRTSSGYRYEGPILNWMKHRDTLVNQALQMSYDGFTVVSGKVDTEVYLKELSNCSIGFNWEGFGRLNYRIPEYFRAGVVMITQPYGEEWPIREDVILEHNVNCVFCDYPEDFSRVAKELLRDTNRLEKIRSEVIRIWNEKLCLSAMGQWYWYQIKKQWKSHHY